MKIGFLQFSPQFGKKQKNLERVRTLLKNTEADIIVLPELFNTGYTFLNKNELSQLAETKDGPTMKFIHTLSKKLNCAFAFGFAEKQGGKFYNSTAFITPEKSIKVYRKTHLFYEEKLLFEPGDTGFFVFEYHKVKLGMIICFDWIYPESSRTLALKGAQVILHSANLVLPHCPDSMKTRAIENHIFIVTANRTGKETRDNKVYQFIGKSQIVAPNGKILVRVRQQECLRVVDIDPGQALNKKITEHNDLLKDRRPEFYIH